MFLSFQQSDVPPVETPPCKVDNALPGTSTQTSLVIVGKSPTSCMVNNPLTGTFTQTSLVTVDKTAISCRMNNPLPGTSQTPCITIEDTTSEDVKSKYTYQLYCCTFDDNKPTNKLCPWK